MKKKPIDLYYSENHLWIHLEDNKEAVLGVTDHLLANWHEIIHIDLPKKGKNITADTPLGEIESSDNLITLITPVNGKVLITNAACLKNPHTILTSPYE
ncbi:MAG: glycine cleavage system protein H, partial [Planctomycetota bacterium]